MPWIQHSGPGSIWVCALHKEDDTYLFLPGSLSSETSFSHLPLSLQPYGFSSGMQRSASLSEIESGMCV